MTTSRTDQPSRKAAGFDTSARSPRGQDIDAVVTWVDGSDPVHQRKRQAAMDQAAGKSTAPISAGRDPTRFVDNGELQYCLASIRKFAPWIRRIHLVTDEQTPDFLTPEMQREYGVTLVDHREIFRSYEWALPTFNSRSIETALWRVPGLAPQFVYFNDDVVLIHPTQPSDFFLDTDVVIRGTWQRLVRYSSTRTILNRAANYLAKRLLGRTRTMYLKAQMEGARLAGFTDRYFRCSHVPHPLRSDTFADYFRSQPDAFSINIQHRFRDMTQYWPISLANHLEIQKENAHLTDNISLLSIVGEYQSSRTIRAILRQVEAREAKFLCLTALERVDPRSTRHLGHVMDRILG